MSNEILIFGWDDTQDTGDRVFGLNSNVATYARNAVSPEKLKTHLESFVSSMKDVLTAVPKTMGNYQIDQVSFTVQVSAQGTVCLLGMAGGVVGASGGITIILKHQGTNSEEDKGQ
jgi:hypothetical protein